MLDGIIQTAIIVIGILTVALTRLISDSLFENYYPEIKKKIAHLRGTLVITGISLIALGLLGFIYY